MMAVVLALAPPPRYPLSNTEITADVLAELHAKKTPQIPLLYVSGVGSDRTIRDTRLRELTGLGMLECKKALEDAGTRPGVDGPELVAARLGPDLLPGLYQSEDRRLARNVITAETELAAASTESRGNSWPALLDGSHINLDLEHAGD